ncbi:MAG: hypothetical protein HY918_02430 [Candidatus Doudnabacteria bacterium]|nr:hypothetical protein [Candidatus Doudnabacteria bacterium]
MSETRERQSESFDSYGGFKQHDVVTGTFEGRNFEGEIKSFTKFLDTQEVVANITPHGNNSGIYNDIHINPSQINLKFSPGKIQSPRFKPGKITRE